MSKRTITLPTWMTRRSVVVTAVILGVVGLVTVLSLLLSATMARVHQQDAVAAVSGVVTAYNSMIAKEVPYTAASKDTAVSQADFTAAAQAYETAYGGYVGKVDHLKSVWVLSEASLKAAYDAFISKHDTFVAENSDRKEVMAALRLVATNCGKQTLGAMDTSDLSHLVDAFDKTFSPCTAAITTLANSKSDTVSSVGKQSMSYFNDLRKHAEAMQSAYQASDRTKFEAEYKQFLSLAESLTTYTDMSKIYTHYREILPGKELAALATLVEEKVK